MKKCPKCGRTLDDSMFYENKDGVLSCWCKDCHRQATRENKRRNPEKNRQAVYKWRENHPDRFHEYERKRYWKDPERFRAYNREWTKKNPEKVLQYKLKHILKKIEELQTTQHNGSTI